MQGAIFKGIYSFQLPITTNCPTGHCKWPPFKSLGVCASCQDVSQKTNVACGRDLDEGYTQTCNYTTPSGGNLTAMAIAGLYNSGIQTMINITSLQVLEDEQLLTFAAIYLPDAEQGQNVSSAQAWECSLKWCAKAYFNASVLNGILTADPQREVPLVVMDPTSESLYHVVPNTTDRFFADQNYSIGASDSADTMSYLSELFTTDLFSQGFDSESSGPGISYALFKSNNISATMNNVASSMTDYIRYAQNTTNVYGEAFESQTYIVVHWQWLIMPLSLVVCTIILLAASITYNRRRGALLWKSSTLPLLFYGLKDWHSDDLGHGDLANMEQSAKILRGRLNKDDKEQRITLVGKAHSC